MLIAELNPQRRLGVEHEMAVPLVGGGDAESLRQTFARVLTANGLPCVARPYSHAPVPSGIDLAVEHDSSIQGESRYSGITWYPVELKTRILTGPADWERIVPKALEVCRYLGARITPSCGHHIHVGMPEVQERPETVRSVYNLMHRFEPIIYGLVAPSRRENLYCHKMANVSKLVHNCQTLECFRRQLSSWDRNHGLNLTHLFGSGPRIEFRYHQGTLDVEKARHWMRLCLRMVDHACIRSCKAADAPLDDSRANLEKLLVTAGLKVNTRVYPTVCPELRQTGRFLLRRWKSFHSSHTALTGGAIATSIDS